MLMVHREFSFDKFHANESSLFEVYSLSHGPDGDAKGTSMSYPVAPTLKSQVPGITGPRVSFGRVLEYVIKTKKSIRRSGWWTMISSVCFLFPLVSGEGINPLASTSNVVLSKSTADAVFGKEDPIGKVVKLNVNGSWTDLMVSAVIQDAPQNSSLE